MYCKNCGNELPDNSKFCNVCGSLVDTQEIISSNSAQIDNTHDNRKSEFDTLDRTFKYFSQKRNEYDRLNFLLSHKQNNTAIIVFSIFLGIIAIPLMIFSGFGAKTFTAVFGIVFVILLALLIFSIITFDKQKKKDADELISLNATLTEYYNNCPIKPIPIGKDYSNPRIIYSLCKIMNDGRADTIKEALRVFTEDMHRMKMEKYAHSTAVNSARTASATTTSAFFNAASFFLK